MHSYELLREVFDKKAPKQVAADLGLSLSMVYKWAEPPNHAADSGTGSGTGNAADLSGEVCRGLTSAATADFAAAFFAMRRD